MSGQARIMAHMVAFYPNRTASLAVARGLSEGGCSFLEVQFPFSDPTADGPDIERACQAALVSGFTISEGFRLLAELQSVVSVPIFVMSYANLPFSRGIDRFVAECVEHGVRGIIVPDLPPDCDEGLFTRCAAAGLAAVPVVSPTMKDDRLARISALGCEYLYATLRSGTTGPFTRIDPGSLLFLRKIASVAGGREVKIFGGFGVSTWQQVESLGPHVHAVVVGSAFVREIAKAGDPYRAVRKKMRELVGG
jgi:tryptophan synthase alpha chain